MELSTVGGRRTSQPPSLHHHHHPHQHKHKHKETGAKTTGRLSKCQQSSPPHQYPPPFVHKKQCRYPEDPDTIETFHDDDPCKLKPKSIGKKQGQQGKWTPQPKTQMNQYETTMISTSASTLPHSYFSQVVDPNPEYSYAYCEPIVTKLNKSHPEKVGSPTGGLPTSISSNALSKGPSAHSLRALLTKSFRKSSVVTSERHTFTTRYGTKENIYEDVGVGTSATRLVKSQSSESVNKVPVAEELKFVQKQHDRIMGELNLSIEALLMPSQDETDQMERRAAAEEQQQLDLDERFSPTQVPLHLMHAGIAAADFDSGISGSSSSGASYSGSMRYRTSMYPPRNLTIYEAPSTSSSSSQLTRPPDPVLPNKLACCFYGDQRGPPPNCPECNPDALEPIESISEKVNFWNKIGKIKGVFNVPGSPKQQSPVNDAPSTSDPATWWKISGPKPNNRIQTQPLPKR